MLNKSIGALLMVSEQTKRVDEMWFFSFVNYNPRKGIPSVTAVLPVLVAVIRSQ